MIDTTGEGLRLVPKSVRERWPKAQRVLVQPSEWGKLPQGERESLEANARDRLIGGIQASEMTVRYQDLEILRAQRRRLTIYLRLALAAVLVAASLGLWAFWSQLRLREALNEAMRRQAQSADPEMSLATLMELAADSAADHEELIGPLHRRRRIDDLFKLALARADAERRRREVLLIASGAGRLIEAEAAGEIRPSGGDGARYRNLASTIWSLEYLAAIDDSAEEEALKLSTEVRRRFVAAHGRAPPLEPLSDERNPAILAGPGSFSMGSIPEEEPSVSDRKILVDESPRHEVTVSPFWIQTREVTNAEYRRFEPTHDPETPLDHPVKVEWHDAMAYSVWLGGTLPTEAQWEYAARAGTTTSRFWGDDPNAACTYANVADRTAKEENPGWVVHECRDGFAGLARVGSFSPNPWSIYDILGNVWEWTSDWFGPYSAEDQLDPVGPATGMIRVQRGGSFAFDPDFVRSAYRPATPVVLGYLDGYGGFRVAWRDKSE